MGGNTSVESPYDVVIDIQKIREVQNGWPVYVHENIEKKLLALLKTDGTDEQAQSLLSVDTSLSVVCLFGLFNRGKTHILSKIGNVNLPRGKKVHTKGLSFVRPNLDRNILFLDTAGTNSPLDRNYRNEPNPYAEKKSTELFIQELSFQLADIIVLVVSELTWPDQEFILAMQKKLIKANKSHPILYVVHNFQDITTEEDLLDMWRECVVSTTDGKLKEDQGLYFYQQEIEENCSKYVTCHFCIANEESEIGKIWNPLVYRYLSNVIGSFNVPSKNTFVKLLTEKTVKALKLYVRNPQNCVLEWNKEMEVLPKVPKKVYQKDKEKNNRLQSHEWKNAKEIEKVPHKGHFFLKCSGEVELLHNVAFDGFKILFMLSDQSFVCFYDVSVVENKGWFVMLDLPGLDEQNDINVVIEREDTRSFLHISGTRWVRTFDPTTKGWGENLGKVTNEFETRRKEGKFDVNVPLDANINDNNDDIVLGYAKGLFSIFLPFKKKASPLKIIV